MHSNGLTMNIASHCIYLFRKGNQKADGPVDLVLCCVDNFEARMAVNTVNTCKQ